MAPSWKGLITDMEKIKIGIIGLGPFCSNYHIPNLLKRSDVEVTAVCDISQKRLDGRNQGLSNCRTYTDYRDMLDPDAIDGLFVSTPNLVHFETCKLALERNIPTIVDKPLTVAVENSEELVSLSKSQNCILMTAFTRHFMPSTEYVRQEILSHALEVQMLTAIQTRSAVKRGVQDGGMLHRRTVHITDVLPWLTGKRIIKVEGNIQYEEGITEETLVDMRFEFEGGLRAHILCIKNCEESQDEINIYSTTKNYRLERDRLYTLTRRERWKRAEDLPTYGNSSDHFIEVLKGNTPEPGAPYADLHSDDGLQALRVVAAIHEAGKTGRTVEVPL